MIGQIVVGNVIGEPIGDRLNGVLKKVEPKVGIGLPTGEALIGELMISEPPRTWPTGEALIGELKNGTKPIGNWLSGIWLSVKTDGESTVDKLVPVPSDPKVTPVPVFVKAERSKVANCEAVELPDESRDPSELPIPDVPDNKPNAFINAPSEVLTPVELPTVVEVEVVPDDETRLFRRLVSAEVVDVVPDEVVDVVPDESERPLVPEAVAMIDRFRSPLLSAEKTGVKLIRVGAMLLVPDVERAVPRVPMLKVEDGPPVVDEVMLIAVGPALTLVAAGGSPDRAARVNCRVRALRWPWRTCCTPRTNCTSVGAVLKTDSYRLVTTWPA